MVSTADRREVADLLVLEGCNVSSATAMVQMSRSAYRYKALPKDDSILEGCLSELTARHPAIGFWACHYRLRNKGHKGVGFNHKRLYRVYTTMKLNFRIVLF